jgi:RES domain-containing protein
MLPPAPLAAALGAITLTNLLDLTDPAILSALGTTEQEMTGTWVEAANPPTQVLAQAAFDSGRIAGIKYASAKRPGGLNLVVFTDKILVCAGNYLEVYDPHGTVAQRIGQ